MAADDIWILGIHMTKFGKHPDLDTVDLADRAKDKVGYEINFNRHFYKYTPPRPLEEIDEVHERAARGRARPR